MQADRRLVEDEERIILASAHLARELEPLGLAARESGRRLPEREVAEPEILEHPEPCRHGLHVGCRPKRRRDVHVHELGQRVR